MRNEFFNRLTGFGVFMDAFTRRRGFDHRQAFFEPGYETYFPKPGFSVAHNLTADRTIADHAGNVLLRSTAFPPQTIPETRIVAEGFCLRRRVCNRTNGETYRNGDRDYSA